MMTRLARSLGLFDATMIVMGGIIGSGIFINPYLVAQQLRRPGWVLLARMAGGWIALSGGFIWAELAARRPQSGGQYAYLREAYHPSIAFIYGWTLLLVTQTGGMPSAVRSDWMATLGKTTSNRQRFTGSCREVLATLAMYYRSPNRRSKSSFGNKACWHLSMPSGRLLRSGERLAVVFMTYCIFTGRLYFPPSPTTRTLNRIWPRKEQGCRVFKSGKPCAGFQTRR
jgi:Amino acid permease